MPAMGRHRTLVAIIGLLIITAFASAFGQSNRPLIEAPRFWNDRDLSDWATPVAGLNVRPGHYSEQEYYSAPVGDLVRTYPVYFPGREPAGYWNMLRDAKPEALVTPGARTTADWLNGGRRVFREMDIPYLRSYDPKWRDILRSTDEFRKLGGHPQKDGTVAWLRWVPTSKGLALGIQDCAGCHSRVMPDGRIVDGAPVSGSDSRDGVFLSFTTHASPGFLDFFSPGETPAMVAWRFWSIPWVANDINDRLKSPDVDPRDFGFVSGIVPRFNSSPFYPTKIPDLIGIKDRKYIDHTATHRMRSPEDLMRYAALISCCDIGDFGSHRMLTDKGRRIAYRFPDEIMFALAQYIYSLEPPENPNLADPRATAGKQVFDREGCGTCHTPPLYTNNKLTPAAGFTPPPDHPLRDDILPLSVGTDPNLALKTRKGTGLYKIPSLRGVWYRGLFSHDGSVTTLEEWLDAGRFRDDFQPSGFTGYKTTHRAVPGHPFGLALNAEEKAVLIAFLKTL
jgi:mono/diheme cytochrome c family protein